MLVCRYQWDFPYAYLYLPLQDEDTMEKCQYVIVSSSNVARMINAGTTIGRRGFSYGAWTLARPPRGGACLTPTTL